MSIKYEDKYRTRVNGKKTFLYICFDHMKYRCYNTKYCYYSHYGGKGIKVESYLQEWTNFVDHMYEILPEGYTMEDMRRLRMSLDRIDTNGNYERGNIRWATQKEQVLNRNIFKNNKSGYLGVSWSKKLGKWRADISMNDKSKYLGYFDFPEEAFDAYQKAYLKHHGPEAHAKMMERQRKHLEQR